jgi:Putative beta-barrel porin-2, OmpL-like. bbp2
VGGFIDTNYLYNLRNHGEGSGGTRAGGDFQSSGRNANDAINFVGENEDNSFTLENFAMFIDKPTTDEHPIGWQMHTYWGEKAQRITFLGPGNDAAAADSGAESGASNAAGENDRFAIATANITWDVPVAGRRVPVTIGKMYTWIGYELVENIGNPNYTHGTVYNNAIPFTHTGMSFDVSEFLPSDKWGLTLYFVNGWDSYIDNNEAKSFGTYLTYQPNDDFFISLATIWGGEGDSFGNRRDNGDPTQMYDIVATYALPQVEKLSLGFNFDWGQSSDLIRTATAESTGHWWAAVGYAMYDYTDNQQGAFRYEYFDDTDGTKGFGGNMYTLTYTHNVTIHENVLLRPEVRYNHYSIPSTPGADDFLSPGDKGNTADDEWIIGVGAEYVF